jgi:hypothetical protein
MTITTADVTNALVGVTVTPNVSAAPIAGEVGFEQVRGIPVKNADGSYTISAVNNASADGNQTVTFSAYTFPGGGALPAGTKGLTYTTLGTPFYIVVEGFTENQVLVQAYTAAGVLEVSNHFLLSNGGTVMEMGETLPLTLYPTGSSYTLPNGTVVTGSPVCFGRGTMISTLDGDVAVEDLREGDLVITVSGEAKPVTWVGSRAVNVARHPRPENVRPVRVARSAFAPNVPSRDLVLSPDHNVFVEGVLIPAKCLINGRNVVSHDVETVEYFHVELAAHDVVYANGLEAETYLDAGNRTFFAGQGVTVAHPDFASIPDQNYFAWEANGYARLVLEGAEVERTRANLAARADELASRSLRRSA